MTTAADVISKADSQLGVMMGTPDVPYAVPFSCAKFTSWVLDQCGISYYDADGPNLQHNLAVERGEFSTTPAIGALVFITLQGDNNASDNITHVSILQTLDGMTVEFNDPEGGPNVVRYRQRGPVGDGYTIGYGLPKYEKGPIVVASRYDIPTVLKDLRIGKYPSGEPWAAQLGADGGVFFEGGPFHGSMVNHPEFIGPAAILHIFPDASTWTIENTAGQLYRPDGGHPFRMVDGVPVFA